MRKKLFFSILALLTCFHLSAQVEKGQFYGEATFGKRIVKFNTNTMQSSFSVGLSEHSTLGVFYNYTRSKSTPSIFSNGYFVSQGVGVSYNYYRYLKNSRKWGWYINGSFAANQTSVYDKSAGSSILNNRYSQRELSFTPGIFFKPSQRVMLCANIGGVSLLNSRYDFITPRSSFASQLNVGIRIKIGGQSEKKKRHP